MRIRPAAPVFHQRHDLAVVVCVVHLHRNTPLLKPAAAFYSYSGFFSLPERRSDYCQQQGDDCYHDKQFDESKSLFLFHFHVPLSAIPVRPSAASHVPILVLILSHIISYKKIYASTFFAVLPNIRKASQSQNCSYSTAQKVSGNKH